MGSNGIGSMIKMVADLSRLRAGSWVYGMTIFPRISITLAVALLVVVAGASAQNPHTTHPHIKQHVITNGDITIVQDCHVIYLDADDAFRQEQAEKGSAMLAKPQHSTAYSCYTTEKPVYDTLVDMDVHDKLNEKGKKLLALVLDDVSYFAISLDADEK
jgi:hypothetical protein